MPHGKEEIDRDRLLVRLHELARDVVDRRNVVGVHRVPQTEPVDHEGDTEQGRAIVERENGPAPGPDVERGQHAVHGNETRPQVGFARVEQGEDRLPHEHLPS